MPEGPVRYTHGHDESVLRSHRWRTAENSAGYVLGHLAAGRSLLDVGCGPGTITVDLARRVAPGPVVGIDADGGVLEAARAAAAEAGVGNVRFEAADVYALPWPDGAFDVVHAHQVLQHLPDPVAALVEMSRVCSPDGIVAVRDADYGVMAWYPAEPALDAWRATYSAVARANGGEPDAGRRLLAWCHAAGLRDARASATTWCFADAEERAWWAGTWAERTTSTRLADDAVAGGHATAAELGEVAAGWRRWADDPDAWFAVVHAEVLASPAPRS